MMTEISRGIVPVESLGKKKVHRLAVVAAMSLKDTCMEVAEAFPRCCPIVVIIHNPKPLHSSRIELKICPNRAVKPSSAVLPFSFVLLSSAVSIVLKWIKSSFAEATISDMLYS